MSKANWDIAAGVMTRGVVMPLYTSENKGVDPVTIDARRFRSKNYLVLEPSGLWVA